MRLRALAAVLALAAGCSTVDTSYRIPNWPADMRVTVHRVDAEAVHARCAKYMGRFESPVACAEWNIPAKTCDIWITPSTPGFVVRHERLHCQGYPRHR
jgi:hypothetical protein